MTSAEGRLGLAIRPLWWFHQPHGIKMIKRLVAQLIQRFQYLFGKAQRVDGRRRYLLKERVNC